MSTIIHLEETKVVAMFPRFTCYILHVNLSFSIILMKAGKSKVEIKRQVLIQWWIQGEGQGGRTPLSYLRFS